MKNSDLVYYERYTQTSFILQVPDFSNKGNPNIDIPFVNHFFDHKETIRCTLRTKYVIDSKSCYMAYTYETLRNLKDPILIRRLRMHYFDHMVYNLLRGYDKNI